MTTKFEPMIPEMWSLWTMMRIEKDIKAEKMLKALLNQNLKRKKHNKTETTELSKT